MATNFRVTSSRLDDKTLVLDTWYAGRLSIPRAMLRGITPLSDANSAVYEGPTGMEGWTIGRMGAGRSWIFRDGALIGIELRHDWPRHEAAGYVEHRV